MDEIEESFDDEWLDDEYADEAYYGDDSDEEDDHTMPCPECGEEIYDDVEQCPACSMYLLDSAGSASSVWTNRPIWWIVLGVLGILAVIFTLAF